MRVEEGVVRNKGKGWVEDKVEVREGRIAQSEWRIRERGSGETG